MNLAELLSQSDQPEPSFPLPEAQRMELTAIPARLRDGARFHPRRLRALEAGHGSR